MHEAAQVLLGENDFSSFRASECQSNSPMREVTKISITRHGSLLALDIQANAFVHHMVRNIVGSLMAVGHKRRPVEWMAELLQAKDRTQAGVTAPAQGLYLLQVAYPDNYAFPPADTSSMPA